MQCLALALRDKCYMVIPFCSRRFFLGRITIKLSLDDSFKCYNLNQLGICILIPRLFKGFRRARDKRHFQTSPTGWKQYMHPCVHAFTIHTFLDFKLNQIASIDLPWRFTSNMSGLRLFIPSFLCKINLKLP